MNQTLGDPKAPDPESLAPQFRPGEVHIRIKTEQMPVQHNGIKQRVKGQETFVYTVDPDGTEHRLADVIAVQWWVTTRQQYCNAVILLQGVEVDVEGYQQPVDLARVVELERKLERAEQLKRLARAVVDSRSGARQRPPTYRSPRRAACSSAWKGGCTTKEATDACTVQSSMTSRTPRKKRGAPKLQTRTWPTSSPSLTRTPKRTTAAPGVPSGKHTATA